MIITQFITKKISKYNINKYKTINEDIKVGDTINILIKDLSKTSTEKIDVCCDECNVKKEVYYFSYNKIYDKYGEYVCNKCAIKKRELTNLKKYGVKNPISLVEFQNKKKKTCKEKYNNENYTNISKRVETNLKKYGTKNAFESLEIREKINNTCLLRYGSKSSLCGNEVRKKTKITMLAKYGYEYTYQIEKFKKNQKNKWYEYLVNKQLKQYSEILSIDYKNNIYHCHCNICKRDYDVDSHIFIQRKRVYNINTCTNCNPINNHVSGLEIQFFNFISDIYNGKIIKNNKKTIPPYELDLYLPDLKLAFEFNGLYWHSEINKPNNYHKIKTDLCENSEIQLIHVYEDDWIYKQNIIKSIVLNKLCKTNNKIFARKTIIKEISDNKLIKNFLNNNNIQGFTHSNIKIGLFYNDELVSLMTFKKIKRSTLKSDEYELLRYCNKINTIVIGGTSKLFKYFIKTYYPNKIISYVDRGYFNGKNYEKIGFKLNHITKPNFYYIVDRQRKNKSEFSRNVLSKLGFDEIKTVHEIMVEQKKYRIYDSGSYKYVINYI
jgi:hypothetical protein